MNTQRATDTDAASTNKALFMQYEDGELNALTQAFNDGNYEQALDIGKRIGALMNRINRGEIKGEGYE